MNEFEDTADLRLDRTAPWPIEVQPTPNARSVTVWRALTAFIAFLGLGALGTTFLVDASVKPAQQTTLRVVGSLPLVTETSSTIAQTTAAPLTTEKPHVTIAPPTNSKPKLTAPPRAPRTMCSVNND